MLKDKIFIKRVDGDMKADGSVKYTDDLKFDGIYGAVVRSSVAYGKIISIDFDKDFDFSDFTIVDYKDIEGKNANTVLIDDQPFLAQEIVRFIGEPILIIGHKDRDALDEAKKHIDIKYELFEPVFTMQDSLAKKNIIFKDDNIYKSINTINGTEPNYSKLKSLTKRYKTPHQEQLYLEPQSMLARYSDSAIKIIGSMQCPFYVESSLQDLTGEKIEVEQAVTGGAFGGKEDYPSLMAAYVYLLSKKSKQDAKLIYSRSQDIAFTPKRHPTQMKFQSYFDESGKLFALEIEVFLDGGAYCTLTPVVQARMVLHIAGFYDCPYIKVKSTSLATNTPPNGAFRGFGTPQAIFGIERHMDDIARYLDISPICVREINLPTSASISLTGAKIDEYKNIRKIFQKTREKSKFDEKYNNQKPNTGIGMALFMHGGGFIGVGETLLASEVLLELHSNGLVEIKVSSVEMGQGALTALCQIVSEELNLPIDMVKYHTPNTFEVPNSGPTVSSRTVMIVGELLIKSSKKIRDVLPKYEGVEEYKKSVSIYLGSNQINEFRSTYKKASNIVWDEDKFYGNGYDGYSLGCYVAEVEIDPIDYRVRVTKHYAFSDVGKVVNLTMAEGQVEGGVAQGIGYGLYERVVYEEGRVKNTRLSDYIVPLASDLPKLYVEFMKSDEKSKGLGELPMDGPAAAIANAVSHALGYEVDTIPILPEFVEKLCR